MIHIHRAFVAFLAFGVASLLGAAATAQPARAPSACMVDIVYAPDDVRAVIEQWVRAEPACRLALEARVIPTEGGFYLLALDERGQVRERIVPDATSAGVLIASWAADDSILSMPIPGPALPPPSAAIPRPAAARVATADSADQVPAVQVLARQRGAATATAATGWQRRLGVGGYAELMLEAFGVRIDLDLKTAGRWRIGAAVSLAYADRPGTTNNTISIVSFDTSVAAYLKRALRAGPWELTPGLGLGFQHAYMEQTFLRGGFGDVSDWEHVKTAWRIALLAQASLGLSYWIAPRTALTIMPVATERSRARWGNSDAEEDARAHLDVAVVGGLQWAW